jgi:RNA polymerase sigma factor (sigma-70 family)
LFGFASVWRFNKKVNTAETKNLLNQYVRTGSEQAFRELVNRYIGLVYSTALRLLGPKSNLADDVTQRVFIQLAKKAGELPEAVSLGGWLHRSACHTAATMLRSERRRQARERQAMELETLTNDPNQALAEIAPLLDEAIESLDAEDRTAILLRYFEKHSFQTVGHALRITEDAARMRVNRALEKLHVLLNNRGARIALPALGAALTAENLMAAPAGLAAALATSALANASLASTCLVLMTHLKIKTLVGGGILLCLAAGFGVILIEPPATAPSEQPISLPWSPELTFAPAGAFPSRVLPTSSGDGLTPATRTALQNLWRALREEPVDEQHYASSHKVINALVAFGPDKTPAIPILLEGLQDTNTTVQMCSAWGFNFLGKQAESAIPELLRLSRSPTQSSGIRRFAIEVLGGMALTYGTLDEPSPDAAMLTVAIPELTSLLRDKNFELRTEAARALGKMNLFATDAIPGLIEMLGSSAGAENVQFEDIPELNQEKKSALWTARAHTAAAAALARMGSQAQDAVPQLSLLLDDPNREVRATAAVALWRIGGHADAANVLADAIYPPRPDQPGWSEWVATLGEMGPQAANCSQTLEAICRWINPEIREPALEALSKIDPPAAAAIRSRIESRK